MSQIIIALIKYINIILILLFALYSFKTIGSGQEEKKKKHYIIQYLCIFFLLTFSFSAIYLSVLEDKIILFYGFILIYFVFTIGFLGVFYPNYNKSLVNGMCMLMTIGFSVLTRLTYTKAIKQFTMCVIITIIAMFIPKIIEKAVGFRKLTFLYIVCGILALASVLILGSYTYGAKLSLNIFGFTVQPSEFVKLSFVMSLSGILCKKANLKRVILSGFIALIHVGVLVLSKDLGTALIFCVIYLFIVYVSSGKSIYLLAGLVAASGASVVAYRLFDHVATRVDAFIDPWPLIDNKGYQITQSLFAIATGGNFGMGIYQGMPGTIPVVDEDFIFSAICEEYGALFGIGLILVIISIFMTFTKIAFDCKDNYYKLCVTGFGVLFIFQVFLTIGGAIKFIPSTGVTLPFISYGRSSIVSLITMFFITLGINLNQNKIQKIQKSEVLNIKKTNKYAFRTNIIFSIIMGAMAAYLFIFATIDGSDIINNSYNKRYQVMANKITKGKILSRHYDPLAETKTDEKGKDYRYYHYGEIFANVVGRDSFGLDGLESTYNYDMYEENTFILTKIANELNNTKLKGNSIVTTLDSGMQKVLYEAFNDNIGAAVVMNAKTGEILSMVSKPTYDPNTINLYWEDISNNENGLLINRATKGLYTPGSTFKILTMLEYIRENPDSYINYTYQCLGTTELTGFTLQCSYRAAHGNCDINKSLAKSCNCSFVNIGKNINIDSLYNLCNELLFNKPLNLSFECNESKINISNFSSEFDIAQTVIGQGTTLVTPMHMAMIMSSIANEGIAMNPTLILEQIDYNNKIVEKYDFKEYGQLISSNEALVLKKAMREVVLSGTASILNTDKYTAYGKTGTAQIDDKGNANSWFTGFVEKSDQTYVIVVVVENVNENTFPAVQITKSVADYIK